MPADPDGPGVPPPLLYFDGPTITTFLWTGLIAWLFSPLNSEPPLAQLTLDRSAINVYLKLRLRAGQWAFIPAENVFFHTHAITSWERAATFINLLTQSAPSRSATRTYLSPQPPPPPITPPPITPPPPTPTGPTPPPAPQPPAPIPPAPSFPMPCQPANNPDGDELMDLQDCMAANLAVIGYWLNQLALAGAAPIQGGTGTPQEECCAELVLAINSGLAAVANAIAGTASAGPSGGAAIDLTAIVAALTAIATALAGFPGIWTAVGAAIGVNLDKITTAITSLGPINVSGIVTQLKAIAPARTVMPGLVDAWVSANYLTPAAGQLIHGSPGLEEVIEAIGAIFQQWGTFLGTIGFTVDKSLIESLGTLLGGALGTWPKIREGIIATWKGPLGVELRGLLNQVASDITAEADTAGAPAVNALNYVLAPLKGIGVIKPGAQEAVADKLFGRAWGMGEMAHLLAIVGGLLPDGVGFAASGWAAEVALASGFREIAQAIHRSWYGIGLARPTAYEANQQFRTLYPTHSDGHALFARALIGDKQRDELDAFNGLTPDYTAAAQAAAYTGMQPRQLVRLMATGLFTPDDISDELTFHGMRPASQARFQLAAPWLATAPQRASLMSELTAAYAAGLLSDTDLTGLIDSAQHNTDRDSLALTTAKWKKAIAATKDLEVEYSTLYRAGLIDDPTYRSYLSGIGLQDDTVNVIAGKAEASANATLQKQTIREAAATAKADAAATRKSLMKAALTSPVNLAALPAALLATGLTPTQVAAWSGLAALQTEGSERWLYGLRLSPAKATLLRQRVAALTDQRKRVQIADSAYVAQLKALGLPEIWVNALQAAADALITPKSAAFPVTVSTS